MDDANAVDFSNAEGQPFRRLSWFTILKKQPMIVRFTNIDRRMRELFQELVFRYSHSFDPIFSDIQSFTIHEGRKTVMRYGPDTWEDDQFEGVSECMIKFEDHAKFSFEDFDKLARQVGAQFLDAKRKSLHDTLERACQKTGNIVNKPLSHEVIFEVLELMEIEFENGQPKMPSIIISPNNAPRMEQLSTEADEDPEIERKYDELIAKKREQFLAREASRKLAG